MSKENVFGGLLLIIISWTHFSQITKYTEHLNQNTYYCKEFNKNNLVTGDLIVYSQKNVIQYVKFNGLTDDSILVVKRANNLHKIQEEKFNKLLLSNQCSKYKTKEDNCFCEVLWASKIIENPVLFDNHIELFQFSDFETINKNGNILLIGQNENKLHSNEFWISTGIFLVIILIIAIYIIRGFYKSIKWKKASKGAGVIVLIAFLAFDQSSGEFNLLYWVLLFKYLIIFSILILTLNYIQESNVTTAPLLKHYKMTLAIFSVGMISEIVFSPLVAEFLSLTSSYSYHNFMIENTGKEQFIYWSTFCLSYFLVGIFNHFLSGNDQYVELQKEKLITQSSLATIQSRINPHFLYNSLNSIASLARTEPQKTEQMVTELAKFYNQYVDKNTTPTATLKEELEILQSYLNIEKIRFGDRLQVQLTVPDEAMDVTIPSFILQPLAENAIKYGYNKDSDLINIHISVSQCGNETHIRVMDDGIPFHDQLESGYGINSIRKKLKWLMPDRHELTFVNKPQKFVEIILKNTGR
jgi:two-component sensor histidine kinase